MSSICQFKKAGNSVIDILNNFYLKGRGNETMLALSLVKKQITQGKVRGNGYSVVRVARSVSC